MSKPNECDCGEFGHLHYSIDVTGIVGDLSCCHDCRPESFTVTYPDGTARQMTDEEREAFLASLASPLN